MKLGNESMMIFVQSRSLLVSEVGGPFSNLVFVGLGEKYIIVYFWEVKHGRALHP
jgi:hypothetical protein